MTGIRWARILGNTTLAIVVTAAAVVTAVTLLLAIVVRHVPNASEAATGVVAELAIAFDVSPDDADELADRVVTAVDTTLLGGTLSTADEIRFVVRVLPLVPIAVVLLAVALAGRGRRLRWLGWGGLVTGVSLLGFTWILERAGDSASFDSEAAEVGARYVAGLVGPGWVIGGVCALIGLGLFLLGRRPSDAVTVSAG
ncbi:MAG: hypothetical protein HZA58_08760 [Acidimicrobiia bacterium]|nr:hypothetical protein [Acidimicrobiia bacterium]